MIIWTGSKPDKMKRPDAWPVLSLGVLIRNGAISAYEKAQIDGADAALRNLGALGTRCRGCNGPTIMVCSSGAIVCQENCGRI